MDNRGMDDIELEEGGMAVADPVQGPTEASEHPVVANGNGYRAEELARIRRDLDTVPKALMASEGVRAAAVTVTDAKKSYPLGSGWVLDGFNMTVPEGTIYGLLGASGCGKTTVLSCIVGRRRLNAGAVRVLGLAPGTPHSGIPGPTIGYMPQELALYGGFTVGETLNFFGRVSGMSQQEIRERTAKLLKFLEIPSETKFISQLSGGQQRRVSLAATLLHRPPILILDEPTVGVDPILRQSIWDLLLSMTRDGHTTVVITTHYIEEARQAHTIGLMRKGVLLAEDAPDMLLGRFGCQSMEDVFLKLSLRQQRTAVANGACTVLDQQTSPNNTTLLEQHPVENNTERNVVDDPSKLRCKPVHYPDHNNTWVCLWKNLVYMRRNRLPVMFVLLLPVIQCGLFGMTVGRDPRGLRMAIVNQDTNCDMDFPGYPANCTTKTLRSLSCRFLNLIKSEKLTLEPYEDIPSALEAVRAGHAWGAIHFPANYSRFLAARHVWGRYVSDKALNFSEVNVWMDMSNQYIGQMVQASLTLATLRFTADIQEGCMWNTRYKPVPVQLMEPIYGQIEPSFQDFCLPGMIVTTVFFMALLVTVGSILEEKRDGLMERTLTAGVTVHEVLASHVIVQLFLMMVMVVIVLVMLLCVFQLTNLGPLFWVIALCMLQGICGMSLGFFISCLCESDLAATYMGLGTFFPMIFLSGMLWPVEGMHFLLRSVGWGLPLSMATTALRCIMGRGWGIEKPDVHYGFISTFVWIAIFITITLITIRIQKKIS